VGFCRICRGGALACIGALVINSSSVEAKTSDGKPMLGFSIVNRSSDATVDGPLLRRVKAAFAAANQGNGSGFAGFLAPDAQLDLSQFTGGSRQTTPFTAATIRAAIKSCIGPWAFDEGSSWVQLSWICSTDKDMPISTFVNFQGSSELSLTVWFDGMQIKTIDAMEPLPIPGAHRPALNAFCAAIANGTPFSYPSRCVQPPTKGN
jgi:hypothetical protein